jgi:hypothetical protein
MGSASSRYLSSVGYFWGYVETDGENSNSFGGGAAGLAPAFVM